MMQGVELEGDKELLRGRLGFGRSACVELGYEIELTAGEDATRGEHRLLER